MVFSHSLVDSSNVARIQEPQSNPELPKCALLEMALLAIFGSWQHNNLQAYIVLEFCNIMLEDSSERKVKMDKTFNTVLLEVWIIAKTGSTVCRKNKTWTHYYCLKKYDYREKMLESQSVVKRARNALLIIWKLTCCAYIHIEIWPTVMAFCSINNSRWLPSASSDLCMFLCVLWLWIWAVIFCIWICFSHQGWESVLYIHRYMYNYSNQRGAGKAAP